MAVQLPAWAALAPMGLFALTAFVLFALDSIRPDEVQNGILAGVSVAGSLVALAVAGWFLIAGTGQPRTGGPITVFGDVPALVIDGLSLFLTGLVASVVTLVVLASYDYVADHENQAEFYSLVFLAATGMAMMATANSLVTALLALELSSLPSYALVASRKHDRGSVEAGLKYFLIGAVSSAIFAYGISLVYASTGALQFDAITRAIVAPEATGVLGLGVMLVLGGFAFKTASVPFHFWAPDAYEGAPAPISAFLSSASKAAGFVLAFRVFLEAFGGPTGASAILDTVDWVLAVQVLAVVTMTVGNFAALKQERVKRMLAYSSVGHAGYVLIALGALTEGANHAFVLGSGMAHLFVYGFMNTGAFLVIALTEHWELGRTFEDFNGLATRAPFAAVAMSIFLFSLAGLPLGGGFLSKFYLLMASINGGVAILAVALIVNSAVSLYYYTRVIKAMWVEEPDSDLTIETYPRGLYAAIAIAVVVTILLLPGFGLVTDIVRTAASVLV